MRKQLLAIILGVAVSAMAVTGALAEEWVHITKNGKKYHHALSSVVKRFETEKMTKAEAEELGYEPSKYYERDAANAAQEAIEATKK